MIYADAIAWLFSLHQFGMKLGLDNIRALTEGLGRPQDRFASVLVAGTNGKGSTAAMLHQMLLSAGVRSGLYTSPHLVRTEERIRIGEHDIGEAVLAATTTEVREVIVRLVASGALAAHPTFFETITAAAFVAFARAEVEIAVLEVGLGGRCDATNIVEPVLSIITTIDLDHQEQLGGTLALIAREKAGILRRGVTGLVGETREEPLTAILESAASIGAPIVRAGHGCRISLLNDHPSTMRDGRWRESRSPALTSIPPDADALRVDGGFAQGALAPEFPPGLTEASMLEDRRPERSTARMEIADVMSGPRASPASCVLEVETPVRRYPRIDCPLPGEHQIGNILLAIRAAELLEGSRIRSRAAIDAGSIARGIATARWPGRLEWIEGRPRLLLDGAHNPAGAGALARYIARLDVKPVLVFGAMRDKDITGMLTEILPSVGTCVFTRPEMTRAAEPEALAAAARAIRPDGSYLEDPAVPSALARARSLAGPRGVVLVAGSLFLVGAAHEALEAKAPTREGQG